MLVNECNPSSLYTFSVELGRWELTRLDRPGSPHIVEAMNHILFKDGIRAFIGTRFEFGRYLSSLTKEPGQGGQRWWISYPPSTILNFLGLCRNSLTPERSSQTFHGSLVVRVLSMILHAPEVDPVLVSLKRCLELGKGVSIEVSIQPSLGHFRDVYVTHNELEEAFSYLV